MRIETSRRWCSVATSWARACSDVTLRKPLRVMQGAFSLFGEPLLPNAAVMYHCRGWNDGYPLEA